MRVLVAFDKFKDAVPAGTACAAVAEAVRSARPDWQVDVCPLCDGGEGFATILTGAAQGTIRRIEVEGPLGIACGAPLGLVGLDHLPRGARDLLGPDAGRPGEPVAVAEMASASGLALVPLGQRDLTRASSVGTGQLLAAAAAAGARSILLGIGGSATHDLGLGALGALGIRFLDHDGREIRRIAPADWPRLARLEGRLPGGLPPISIACDVENPLLGPRGALATYGAQKGLRAAEAGALERETRRVSEILAGHFGAPAGLADRPGAGAAGGIAFGLMAAAGARLLAGFELVSSWLDLERRIASADLVLTGEGRFDASSLQGKGPGAVARRALGLGIVVRVFAGAVELEGAPEGLLLHAVTPEGTGLAEALAGTERFLRESVLRNLFSL
jgi:glycerate kinase